MDIEINRKNPIRSVWSALQLYASALGIALTIAAAFQPLLTLSRIASYLLENWSALLQLLWAPLFALLDIDLPAEHAEILTVSLLLLAMGLTSRITANAVDTSFWVRLSFLLCNIAFSVSYTVSLFLRLSFPDLLVIDFFAFIFLFGVMAFAIFIAEQLILLRKFIASLVALLTIIALDRAANLIEFWVEVGANG